MPLFSFKFSLRRAAVLGLAAALAAGLTACESTARFSSRVVAKPDHELKTVHLALVENDWRMPGLAVGEQRDEALVNYGYFELGRLLKERAPTVLAANGLTGKVQVVPQPKAGEVVDLAAADPKDGILLLRVTGVRHVKPSLVLHRSYLTLDAKLVDKPAGAAKRSTVWDSRVGFRLGADEAMGVLRIHRVDAEFVDTLLVGLLNSMARDGIIVLPQGKAVVPKAG